MQKLLATCFCILYLFAHRNIKDSYDRHRQTLPKASVMMKNLLVQFAFLLLLPGLSGCGGTKVLKEPEALTVTQSLATASDRHLSGTLDWVIFRDGPGTWARNVDWDEYLIRVQNLGDDSLQITKVIVVDSLGTRIEPRQNRKQLVKGT